jgi:hypothetical protein
MQSKKLMRPAVLMQAGQMFHLFDLKASKQTMLHITLP